MISDNRVTACGFSIFDMMPTRPRNLAHFGEISGRWTKESATQSTSAASAASRIGAVLFGQGTNRQRRVGQAYAFLSEIEVPATTGTGLTFRHRLRRATPAFPSSINSCGQALQTGEFQDGAD